MRRPLLILAILLMTPLPLLAGRDRGKGQGAVVLRDNAIVYADSSGNEVRLRAARGDWVVGITTTARIINDYSFETENERVQVLTLGPSPGYDRPSGLKGWMNAVDLSPVFYYDCGCGPVDAECSPLILGAGLSEKWNSCFEEAAITASQGIGRPSPPGSLHVTGQSLAAPSAVATDCGRSFAVSGMMLTGVTFEAAVDVEGIEKETLMKRVVAQLPDNDLSFVSSDVASGVIVSEGRAGKAKGRKYSQVFEISPAGAGMRLATTVKLPRGLTAPDDAARDEICKMLTAIQQTDGYQTTKPHTATRSQSSPEAESESQPSSVEERLKKLDRLKKNGLITDDEYKKKRAEILKDL